MAQAQTDNKSQANTGGSDAHVNRNQPRQRRWRDQQQRQRQAANNQSQSPKNQVHNKASNQVATSNNVDQETNNNSKSIKHAFEPDKKNQSQSLISTAPAQEKTQTVSAENKSQTATAVIDQQEVELVCQPVKNDVGEKTTSTQAQTAPDSVESADFRPKFTDTSKQSSPFGTQTFSSLQDVQRAQRRKNWLLAIVVLLVLVTAGWWWRQHRRPSELVAPTPSQTTTANTIKDSSHATITGYILYNGLTPPNPAQDRVAIYARESGTQQEFFDTGIRLLTSETTWQWTQAKEGANYEIQAALISGGVIFASSNVETVTAPAVDVNLVFNLNWQNTGTNIDQYNPTLSGVVQINGYIPVASVLVISLGETTADNQLQHSIYQFPVSSNQMGYTISGLNPYQRYYVDAYLQTSGGQNIGAAQSGMFVNVFDTQANLIINSLAQPPVTTSSTNFQPIGGKITVNGPVRDNSRLLVLGKISGTDSYQVWQTLSDFNQRQLEWQYNQAVQGEEYDVEIALQVRGENVSTSQAKTVRAPAKNVSFTINTNFDLADLNNEQVPVVEPCQRNLDVWETYITLPVVNNAGQYWLQVGKSGSPGSYYDNRVNADGSQVRVRVGNIPGGVKVQTRFSYSACKLCQSDQNFSRWSKTVTFTCQ